MGGMRLERCCCQRAVPACSAGSSAQAGCLAGGCLYALLCRARCGVMARYAAVMRSASASNQRLPMLAGDPLKGWSRLAPNATVC